MALEFLSEIDENKLVEILEAPTDVVTAGDKIEQEIGRELSTDEFWIMSDMWSQVGGDVDASSSVQRESSTQSTSRTHGR